MEKYFLVLPRDRLVKLALHGTFGEKLRHMAAEIGLHLAIALGLAPKRLGGVQHGVVIDDLECLERNVEALAIVQNREVVIRQSHRTGIEIEAGIELAALCVRAHLGDGVAAANGNVPAAGTVLIFQNLNPIAGPAHFQRRSQPS